MISMLLSLHYSNYYELTTIHVYPNHLYHVIKFTLGYMLSRQLVRIPHYWGHSVSV